MARAGIIGCGLIAGRFDDFGAPGVYSHAKGYRHNPAFDRLAVLDCVRPHAEMLAAKADAEIFDDLEALLRRFHPDVVSVCTPDNHHFTALRLVLSHSAAPSVIFCEKPICRTRDEFAHIRELEEAGRSRIIVNHSRRFDPAHQNLKRLVGSGELGRFVQGHVDYYGGWRHLGVHVVDILQFILGADFEPRHVAYCCPSKYADDPTLHVLGTFGDAPLRLTGFAEEFYQILDMSLLFERGQVRITDFGQSIEVLRKTVNAVGERVLVRDDSLSGRGMQDPMANSISLIARYLSNRDQTFLDPFGLAEAGRTMEALWKGADLHAD